MGGLSRTNLLYMRAFAETWPDESIVQQVVGQIPWGHNVRLLDLVKDPEERLWYIHAATDSGWSRNVLVLQIESGLYRRQGKAITNFQATLPKTKSDLAQELLKDPYNFDFLTLTTEAQERDLEKGLLTHLRQLLIELGVGFAFVGSQVPLEVGGEDFKLDLLFYHLKLRCFIVKDLKMTPFKPEYAGKMNFYLSAVDGLLRHADDKPSIGLILCKTKNKSSPNTPCGTAQPRWASQNSGISKNSRISSKAHSRRLKRSRPNWAPPRHCRRANIPAPDPIR
jgi:predicted nuclease of restriction endonuclease-like (RecB) superfamily